MGWKKTHRLKRFQSILNHAWMKCVSAARSKRGLCDTKQFKHIRRRRECRREKQAAQLAQGKVTQAPRYHTDARKVSAALVFLGRRAAYAHNAKAPRHLRAALSAARRSSSNLWLTRALFIYLLSLTARLFHLCATNFESTCAKNVTQTVWLFCCAFALFVICSKVLYFWHKTTLVSKTVCLSSD